MSDATRDTFRKPPLTYVVAEIVIAPHYGIAAAMPALQESLRATYPRTVEGAEVTIDAKNAPTHQQIWRLISSDETRGVSVGSRSLALHSTHYVDSKEFLTAWDEILSFFERAVDNVFVERIGLRYVDLIVPSASRAPLDYITETIRGIQLPFAGSLESNFWSCTYAAQGSQINARVAAPSPPGMLFPPNFNLLPLQRPQIWQEAEMSVAANRKIGFIDTDASRQVNNIFAAATISGLFRELKTQVSSTFKVMMSDVAKEEWI